MSLLKEFFAQEFKQMLIKRLDARPHPHVPGRGRFNGRHGGY